MSWSISIGRLLGSELKVHVTFFLLLFWIGAAAYATAGAAAAIDSVLFVVALFACVIAHEYGHALTARRFGISTRDITLLPIGGMARLERMPENPKQEILVALAGPAVNIVIWAVLALVFGARASLQDMAVIGGQDVPFVTRLASVNLFLALFNLLPAFPMDGGRVLRAVIALFTNRVRATQLAAIAGQIMAFLFGFLGLTSGNFLLLLIAFFVFMAAGAESSDVQLRSLARSMLARDAMITSFESLMPGDSLSAADMTLIRTTQHEFPVLNPDGTLAGFLTRSAIFKAHHAEHKPRQVAELMVQAPALPLNAKLSQVLDAMQDGGTPAVAITGPGGQVIGYITRENIGELIVVSNRA
ncbi:site-2 protease family protein [Actibacterium sp. XHP0104]|uniref:site-2 protease family protein n=1 Tax=Actibacterium sp. XHP0104 TaxID=2984335 RepID=UPI0021E6F49E|nr:site-2 protease family protein [Actibacterium sp. XHP0104]MCV2881145.1 site-2 protease family protein [Actibacterium sp. XHP0104]